MTRHDRLKDLVEQYAIKLAPEGQMYKLASGKMTGYYVNMRGISLLSGEACELLGAAICALLPHGVTHIGAVPTAGLPLIAPVLMNRHDLHGFYVRATNTGHGLNNLIEGYLGDSPAVLIEDTVTTGGSLLQAINTVRAQGREISHAIAVFDREDGGKQLLAANGVELRSVFTASQFGLN